MLDLRPILSALVLLGTGAAVLGCLMFFRRWPRRRVVYGGIGLLALSFFLLYGPFVGYTRRVTRPMEWRVESSADRQTGGARVILTFRDFPQSYLGLDSEEVANYLKTLPGAEVPVEFEVIYDYGHFRGFSAKRIGELTAWQAGFTFSGSQGNAAKSPFE